MNTLNSLLASIGTVAPIASKRGGAGRTLDPNSKKAVLTAYWDSVNEQAASEGITVERNQMIKLGMVHLASRLHDSGKLPEELMSDDIYQQANLLIDVKINPADSKSDPYISKSGTTSAYDAYAKARKEAAV